MILTRVQRIRVRAVLVDQLDVRGGSNGKELHHQTLLLDVWLLFSILPVYTSSRVLTSEPANQGKRKSPTKLPSELH